MALTPLPVEIIDDTGVPVDGATIELRNELTGVTVDGYNRDGSVMTPPILTDSAGSAVTWLPNGIYEWRSTGAWTTAWRPFPAYRGRGYEAYFLQEPNTATPQIVTYVNAGGGVDDLMGTLEVELDFAHDHMENVVIYLSVPYEYDYDTVVPGVQTPPVEFNTTYVARDGLGDPLVGEEVEVRDAITGDPVVLNDALGAPLSTPYLTAANGKFSGFCPTGIYEWRVPTSANHSDWVAVAAGSGGHWLWSGPDNVDAFGMTPFAHDGVVTFGHTGGSIASGGPIEDLTFHVFSEFPTNLPSVGTWRLFIAGVGTGTLRAATLKFVPL